jgi:outer membrane protein assembly factor BamE (lipoprotein component of BamABCDE complex)
MKKAFSIVIIIFIASCSTHHFSRPPMHSINIGMTHDEVIKIMGNPATTEKSAEKTAIVYTWDDPWDGSTSSREEYFIVFDNDKVIDYGLFSNGARHTFGVWRGIELSPTRNSKLSSPIQ